MGLRLRSLVALTLTLAVALAGGAVAVARAPVTRSLLRGGEIPGLSVVGAPHHVRTISAYLRGLRLRGGSAARERALLRRAGFAGGVDEALVGRGRRAGRSSAYVLRRHGGPRLLRDALVAEAKGLIRTAPVRTTFRVSGVPTARGVAAAGPGVTVADLYWTQGSCALGVAYAVESGSHPARAAERPAIAGLRAIRRRTRGHCG